MRITYSPQRTDKTVSYTFDGAKITATTYGRSDTFDFSEMPDGEAAAITSTIEPCPVLAAKRVDGELHVTLLRTIGPRPTDDAQLEAWRKLWTEIEEVVGDG